MNAGNRGRLYIACFTDAGERLAERIAAGMKPSDTKDREEMVMRFPSKRGEMTLSEWTKARFNAGCALLFIGASGIAIRAVTPFISDKTKDPAVLCMDEKGKFVIPLLSGHIGGANRIAKELSELVNAQAVLTTATDVNDLFAIDVFAERNDLAIDDMEAAKRFSAALLKKKEAYLIPDMLFSEGEKFIEQLPAEIKVITGPEARVDPDVPVFSITPFTTIDPSGAVFVRLVPRCVLAGMGCRRGKTGEELYAFLKEVMEGMRLDMRSVASIHSIDLKKYEPGMRELSERLKVPFYTYTADILREVKGVFSGSSFVERTTGVDNVCERAACAGGGRLIAGKTAGEGMTAALGISRV